jgi:hypothetical protein
MPEVAAAAAVRFVVLGAAANGVVGMNDESAATVCHVL